MSKKRGRTTKIIDDAVESPSRKRKKKYERKTTKEFVEETVSVNVIRLDVFKKTLSKKMKF